MSGTLKLTHKTTRWIASRRGSRDRASSDRPEMLATNLDVRVVVPAGNARAPRRACARANSPAGASAAPAVPGRC
jgi:hypothetical protein